MNDRLVACVLDTLLPGDDGAPPLPSASEISVERVLEARLVGDEGSACRRAIAQIAREAGGAHAFTRAPEQERAAAVAAAERARPREVRALVVAALEVYYQSEPVIRAMGWTPRSPQPLGHAVEELDRSLLEPVKARAPVWRAPDR